MYQDAFRCLACGFVQLLWHEVWHEQGFKVPEPASFSAGPLAFAFRYFVVFVVEYFAAAPL